MPIDFTSHISAAHFELEAARKLLNAEISVYPAPIAGCDAQFNHLLAERQKVHAALCSLNEAAFIPTPRSPSPMSGVESR